MEFCKKIRPISREYTIRLIKGLNNKIVASHVSAKQFSNFTEAVNFASDTKDLMTYEKQQKKRDHGKI